MEKRWITLSLLALGLVVAGTVTLIKLRESIPTETSKPEAPASATQTPQPSAATKTDPLKSVSKIEHLSVAPANLPEFADLDIKPALSVRATARWDEGTAPFAKAFEQLQKAAQNLKLTTQDVPFVVYRDLEDEGFTFHAFLVTTTEPPFELPEGITREAPPAGRAVKVSHFGSFETIAETYGLADEFLSREGYKEQGIYIEQYITPVQTDGDESIINIYVFVTKEG